MYVIQDQESVYFLNICKKQKGKAKHMTQSDAASAAGISQQAVSRIEKGEERYKKGLVITEAFNDKSLAGISEESMETFKRVLDKLIANNETDNE